MSIVAAHPPSDLRRISVGLRIAGLRHRRFSSIAGLRHRRSPSPPISDGSPSDSASPVSIRSDGSSKKGCDKEKRGFSADHRLEPKSKLQPLLGSSSWPSDLHFDRLQLSDEDCDCKHRRVFGQFIAREALVDEELWTTAWLQAESEWEDKSNNRHADSLKRKFAEQEFHALKRRSTGQQLMGKSICIIVVKKDEMNVKRTILSSIVGTLDISIRHLLCGETFPGEHLKASAFCSMFGKRDPHKYGYVSNLCVAKYARRQGIASNMLLLAVEAAKSSGVDEVYAQVHKDNLSARKLYEKIGFEIAEAAVSQYLEEQRYLLYYKI